VTPETIRSQILAAVVALLEAANADRPAHLTAVHRFRFRPLDKDKLSALVVYPVRNTEGDSELERREDDFTFVVECRAKQLTAATTADELVEELYWWAVSRILADPTLGGLVTDVVEGDTQWQGEDLAEAYAAAGVQFRATFHRQFADPSQD